MKIYLVGGAVRDKILGKTPNDLDYCVIGSTIEEMLNAGFKQVGNRFPVFTHPVSGDEYSLARIEKKNGNTYQDFELVFSPDTTLSDDLYRRDLTINAIAYDELSNEYIDPYNGIKDIQNKVLKHVSNHFIEDPFRVIRLARFQSKLPDFNIDNNTFLLTQSLMIESNKDILTDKRLFVEFRKAFNEDNFFLFIKTLDDFGFFKLLFNKNMPKQYNKTIHNSIEKELAYLLFLFELNETEFNLINEKLQNNKLIAYYYKHLIFLKKTDNNFESLTKLTQSFRLSSLTEEDYIFFKKSNQ